MRHSILTEELRSQASQLLQFFNATKVTPGLKYVQVNNKVVSVLAMKSYRGRGGIAPLSLNLGTK